MKGLLNSGRFIDYSIYSRDVAAQSLTVLFDPFSSLLLRDTECRQMSQLLSPIMIAPLNLDLLLVFSELLPLLPLNESEQHVSAGVARTFDFCSKPEFVH
jgi:hypothetical protein